MTVLVINSGSSSIKYQLVDVESEEAIASGLVERIGEPDGPPDHEAALRVSARHAWIPVGLGRRPPRRTRR